jgi:glycosyltransferase involved in cell wall biosynthesis
LKLVFVTSESFIDHSYTIVRELSKKCEIYVFLQAKRRTEELDEWCRNLNAEFIQRKRFRNPLGIYKELKLIRRIRKLDPDKVWFDTMTVNQVILGKMLLKNLLVTIHDVEFHPNLRDYFSFLSLWLTFKLLKRNICVASKAQAEGFEKIFGFKPLIFQLPIIDYYREISDKRGSNAKVYANKMKFFFFGTIERYKGVETLVEAAEILENIKLSFELNIYGKIKYSADELLGRVSKLKNVKLFNRFIDYKEIHQIYSENDVQVLPYRQVTQCGPLLIGYCEGVPSICSDLPGFKEYVDDNKSGIIFRYTSRDLADKMEILINQVSKVKEMSEYIKTRTAEKFSMGALSEDYLNNLKMT